MKLLCKLGIHKWFETIKDSRFYRSCERCGCKDVWRGGLVQRWEPEE